MAPRKYDVEGPTAVRPIRLGHGGWAVFCRKIVPPDGAPRKLALTLAVGITIGTLPVAWGTTLLCAAVAFSFRLNQAAIQAANYLAYPLQVVLFLPFYSLGAKIFSGRPTASAGVPFVVAATLKALGAWLMVAPGLALVLYPLLLLLIRRLGPHLYAGDGARQTEREGVRSDNVTAV